MFVCQEMLRLKTLRQKDVEEFLLSTADHGELQGHCDDLPHVVHHLASLNTVLGLFGVFDVW